MYIYTLYKLQYTTLYISTNYSVAIKDDTLFFLFICCAALCVYQQRVATLSLCTATQQHAIKS